MKIAIDSIHVGERKRELGDLSEIIKSIQEIGLLNPITVRRDKSLVAGLHRLEAVKCIGWTEIDAHIIDLEGLQAELAEIDENLIRNELHWFDRDKHLARRKEIYEEMHPETAIPGRGKNQYLPKPLNGLGTPTFVQDTAIKIGSGVTVVKESIQRAKTFTPEQGKVLKKADIKSTEATKLARMEEPQRAAVIEVIADGKAKDVKEAKAVVRQEEKQEAFDRAVITPGHCRVYHCSVAALHVQVDPASVDYIITDPPYPKEYLSVYTDLAEFATYALKPGGSLIAMVGQSYLPEIIESLGKHLNYHWTLAYLTSGGQAPQLWQKNVNTFWKPLLWFTKGKYNGTWIGDVCKSQGNDKDHHHWGQSESGMADILNRFTSAGQVICDPFVGGGTTAVVALDMKRYFIGCDVDEACVQKVLQRVQEVGRGQL